VLNYFKLRWNLLELLGSVLSNLYQLSVTARAVRLFREIDNLFPGKSIGELLSAAANRAGVLLNDYFFFKGKFRLYRRKLKR
jgi:hypothetical protein